MASTTRPERGILHLLLVALALLACAGTATAQDRIGVYWDEDFTQTQTSVPAPFTVVTGHVVIHDPTSGGGILAWECKFDIDGPALVSGWNILGQAINAATPPDFAVGLASPLPPAAATEVASFDLVITEVAPVQVNLVPLFFASIPGEMAYIGGDDPEQLAAMTTVTGVPLVATVNEDVPVIDFNRVSIQFGIVPIGAIAYRTVRVANAGGGVLMLDIGLDCPGSGFSLPDGGGPVSLTAGQSFLVEVAFSPVDTLARECQVLFGEGLPSIPMLGQGRTSIESWEGPAGISFGAVPVGQSRNGYTYIRNTGETALSVDVALVDPCPGMQIISGGGPATVQPGYYHNVSVRFSPGEPAGYACGLSFGSRYDVASLTGSGYYSTPGYEILPSHLDFPLTEVDGTSEIFVTVTNTGTGTFVISPAVSGPAGVFGVNREGDLISVPPGADIVLTASFTPPAEEFYQGDLQLGGGLPTLSMTGTGGHPVILCDVSADTLAFEVSGIGESVSNLLLIENLGNVPFPLAPQVDRSEFAFGGNVPAQLAPGETYGLAITYTAETLLPVNATLLLGSACSPVRLRVNADIGIQPGDNQVGFFWDEDYTAIETGIGEIGATVPVHLALLNATNTSGVAGWECRIEISGQADFTGIHFAGNAINAGNPNNQGEFAVGIGLEPLPYAAGGTLLASFDLLVTDPDPNNVALSLYPLRQPSIPGLMAWVPWDDITDLTPMVSVTGSPVCAWINTDVAVGLDLPTPRATPDGATVRLSWEPRLQDVDGFHVDRRDPDGTSVRLTASPLPPAERITFLDSPPHPAGTTVYYSYTAVRAGAPIGVSPEIAVTVGSVPTVRTGLLANVPNPFNPETRIRYRLARAGAVRLSVFDVTGRLVRTLVDAHQGSGAQDVTWRGRDDAGRPVASGAYYVRLETADGVDHRKVMMLK